MTSHIANNVLTIRGLMKSQFGIKCKDLKIVMVRSVAGDWGWTQIHRLPKSILAHMEGGIGIILSNVGRVRNRTFRDFSHRGIQVVNDGVNERVWQRSIGILDDHDNIPGPGRQLFPFEIRRQIVSGLGKAIWYLSLV